MPWKPGQSGNPAGPAAGAKRAKIQLNKQFLSAMAMDFEKHGISAISKLREDDAGQYLRLIASVLPKELEVRTFANLTEDQVDDLIAALQHGIGNGSITSGESETALRESTEPLSTLQ